MKEYAFARIKSGEVCEFSCTHSDLDPFFCRDRIGFENKLSVVTYGLRNDAYDLVAMVSFANASINLPDVLVGPAVKIVAFGVRSDLQDQRIGTNLFQFIQSFFLLKNKTGCRYILIDAYNDERTIRFYRDYCKCIDLDDVSATTRSMYFDLLDTKRAFDDDPATRAEYEKAIKDMLEKGEATLRFREPGDVT